MVNYKRVAQECFWDLNISDSKTKEIVAGDDTRKKEMLFEKILLNSTALFQDMQIFDRATLKKLLAGYRLPQFNRPYAFRRKNMVEVYFFDAPLLIDELRWVA